MVCVRVGVRLRYRLQLAMMLLGGVHGPEFGHVENYNRAVAICARQHESLAIGRPEISVNNRE